jgi:hypothetical protein
MFCNPNLWEDFSKPKIVWKRVGSILRFSYDESNAFALDSTCFATGDKIEFLVCALNSAIGRYMLHTAPQTGTGDLLISVQAIEPLRIPIPEDNNWFSSQLAAIRTNYDIAIEKRISSVIYSMYNLSVEEIEFIESQCNQ